MEVILLGPNVPLKMCMLLAKERQMKVLKYYDPDSTHNITLIITFIVLTICHYFGAIGLIAAYCLSCIIRWRKNEIVDGDKFIDEYLSNDKRLELANKVYMKPVPRGSAEDNFAALSQADKRELSILIKEFLKRNVWNVLILEQIQFPEKWEKDLIKKKTESI
ncbi:uncharacterized protein [Leptinotarsa decemlineata]|uniref:uncharacterized protein n=1 Tax=Leptinotarsa decemlineata TaxID=7539 RepID=UPI000C253A09|nr:uncharacterized protein LOC111509582 [Leptinotarsa decemlineata]